MTSMAAAIFSVAIWLSFSRGKVQASGDWNTRPPCADCTPCQYPCPSSPTPQLPSPPPPSTPNFPVAPPPPAEFLPPPSPPQIYCPPACCQAPPRPYLAPPYFPYYSTSISNGQWVKDKLHTFIFCFLFYLLFSTE